MTTYDKNKNTIQKPNDKNTISKIGTIYSRFIHNQISKECQH